MKYFTVSEFNCSETGENEMKHAFMGALDGLRGICGFPFVITSGYRSPSHSIEAAKQKPGTHAQGIAADIQITNSTQRFSIVSNALELGFSGIGIAKDFIHLDMRNSGSVMWVYGN
ncbi:MAG: hypothetical protein KOO63_08115 [Bacteroidales bacterium]|nr:hypothetical protein [Candidatus Latescibacterota bacterium]